MVATRTTIRSNLDHPLPRHTDPHLAWFCLLGRNTLLAPLGRPALCIVCSKYRPDNALQRPRLFKYLQE